MKCEHAEGVVAVLQQCSAHLTLYSLSISLSLMFMFEINHAGSTVASRRFGMEQGAFLKSLASYACRRRVFENDSVLEHTD